jgi:hypothetical protein
MAGYPSSLMEKMEDLGRHQMRFLNRATGVPPGCGSFTHEEDQGCTVLYAFLPIPLVRGCPCSHYYLSAGSVAAIGNRTKRQHEKLRSADVVSP